MPFALPLVNSLLGHMALDPCHLLVELRALAFEMDM
jgi:hypothetical protein